MCSDLKPEAAKPWQACESLLAQNFKVVKKVLACSTHDSLVIAMLTSEALEGHVQSVPGQKPACNGGKCVQGSRQSTLTAHLEPGLVQSQAGAVAASCLPEQSMCASH